MMIKKVVKMKMMALFMVLFSSAVFANTSPYVLMQQTANKLFSDIKASQNKIKANPNYLRTLVRNDLMPYVHIKYAGSRALGNYYSSTKAHHNQFFKAFEQFVEQSYAQALALYTNQKIEIEKEKPLSDKKVVSIRVNVLATNGAPPIKLDFKWRKNSKTGEWQAYDMAAEGVSMLATKQKEWAGVLRQQGIESLIKQIKISSEYPITLSK